MVELWRCDSWAAPLLGDDLQLLRTDTDAEGFGGGPGPGSAADAAFFGKALPLSCGASVRSRASVLSSALARHGQTPISRPESVLRGAACRSSSAATMTVPLPPTRLASVSAPTAGSSDRGKRAVTANDLAGCLLLPESSVFAWDDDSSLPLESSWMFDSSAEPPEELLELCAGGVDSACGEAEVQEPTSPVSVFYEKSATEHSVSTSACSEAGDCMNSSKPDSAAEDAARDNGPEGSTDTTNTTALNLLPEAGAVDSHPKPETPAPVPVLGKRTRQAALQEEPIEDLASRVSKKGRRPPSNRSVPPKPSPSAMKAVAAVKAVAAGSSKKPKGRQSCLQCSTFSTPQWREGPMGARTLCNACGVRYRKQLNQAKKAKGK